MTLAAFLLVKFVGTILGVLIFWCVVRPWLNSQCEKPHQRKDGDED
jgi:hypothetical protein